MKAAGCMLAVADVRGVVEPAVENLLEFDRVVRELAGISEAILPARFGAVSQTAAALREEIAGRADALSAALDHVAGRVQMTVRIPAGPKVPAGPKGPGKGADYLLARARASNPPALTKMRRALKDLVREERIESGPGGATVHHLIAAADVRTYLDRAGDFRASGPFPPYAFVPGIDHALWPGHDDKKSNPTAIRSTGPRAHRRSAGNAHR
jgi:hypothetical protein